MDNPIAPSGPDPELQAIADDRDIPRKHLRLAARLTREFRAVGLSPVFYGGAVVEQFTGGQYTTGDIDFGFLEPHPDRARVAAVMKGLGASRGLRQFLVAGILLDVGSQAELLARPPFIEILAPDGTALRLETPEEAFVQRCLIAVYPTPQPDQRRAAYLLAACHLTGLTPMDWNEVVRLARLPLFDLELLVHEIRDEAQASLQ